MLAGAADAAADTDHAFHEIIGQLADLKQHQGLLAFCGSVALHDVDIGIFAGLLQAFQDCCRYAAAVAKTLTELFISADINFR